MKSELKNELEGLLANRREIRQEEERGRLSAEAQEKAFLEEFENLKNSVILPMMEEFKSLLLKDELRVRIDDKFLLSKKEYEIGIYFPLNSSEPHGDFPYVIFRKAEGSNDIFLVEKIVPDGVFLTEDMTEAFEPLKPHEVTHDFVAEKIMDMLRRILPSVSKG